MPHTELTDQNLPGIDPKHLLKLLPLGTFFVALCAIFCTDNGSIEFRRDKEWRDYTQQWTSKLDENFRDAGQGAEGRNQETIKILATKEAERIWSGEISIDDVLTPLQDMTLQAIADKKDKLIEQALSPNTEHGALDMNGVPHKTPSYFYRDVAQAVMDDCIKRRLSGDIGAQDVPPGIRPTVEPHIWRLQGYMYSPRPIDGA